MVLSSLQGSQTCLQGNDHLQSPRNTHIALEKIQKQRDIQKIEELGKCGISFGFEHGQVCN